MTTSPSPGPRYAPPEPGDWDASQRAFAERFTTGRRAAAGNAFVLFDERGRLTGPASVWVLSPGVGGAVEALGQQMRYELGMPARTREAVILAVAAHEDSAFERYAHEAAGRAAGLDGDALAALRAGGDPADADESERLALDLARRMLRAGDLDDEAYAAGVAGLGEAGLFELVTLVGYYRLAALQLRVFRIDPPVPAPPVE